MVSFPIALTRVFNGHGRKIFAEKTNELQEGLEDVGRYTNDGDIVAMGPSGLRTERRERLDVGAEGVLFEDNPTAGAHATTNATILNQVMAFASTKERDVFIRDKAAVAAPIKMARDVLVRGRGAARYATLDADAGSSGLFWRGTSPLTRANSTVYALGATVFPATPNGMYYEATTGGTSSGGPPAFPTQEGATVADGGVTWTCRGHYALIQWGSNAQTTDIVGAELSNLYLEGNSDANLTMLAIRSNSPTSALYVTRRGLIRQCVFSQGGIGVQWGNTVFEAAKAEEQADFFRFEQCDFYNMAKRGVVVDGGNCADNSWFHVCAFITCSPAGEPYIEVKRGGYITFEGSNGGGDTALRDFFEAGTLCGGISFRECQAEGMRNFIHVSSTNNAGQQAIELNHCIMNDDVHIQGIRTFVGIGNEWAGGKLVLDRAGCNYQAMGDLFLGTGGSYVVEKAGGNFRNDRMPDASTNEHLNRGERIQLAIPTVGTGTFEHIVARTGQRRTARANSAAVTGTGGGFLTWKPGESISIGDVRLAVIPDGKKYTASNSGTTGATAADEPLWDVHRTFTDAAGITWAPTSNTNPLLHTISPDNGRAYRLLVAGTTDASLPATFNPAGSPTVLGAQVVDGSATWQDTGPSALVVNRSL